MVKKSIDEIEKGNTKLENKEYHKALAHFNIALSIAPYSSHLRLLTARAMLGMKQCGEVIKLTT